MTKGAKGPKDEEQHEVLGCKAFNPELEICPPGKLLPGGAKFRSGVAEKDKEDGGPVQESSEHSSPAQAPAFLNNRG